MDAIVLAGGKGTRLQHVVSDRPKPLASIQGRPFLDILLEHLAKQGLFERIFLSVGYMAEQIAARYAMHTFPFEITCVPEEEPLGTGGAIVHCLTHASSSNVFVCNGDSFLATPLQPASAFHTEHDGIGTIIAREVDDVSRYGALCSNAASRIERFTEKEGQGPGLINAGMYFLQRNALLEGGFPRIFSIEQIGFPSLLQKGLYAYAASDAFIDIGTETSYHEAQHFFTESIS